MSDIDAQTPSSTDDVGLSGDAPDPTRETSGGPDDLTAALQEKQSLQDRLLRTAAEFDNFRKRVDRERRDLLDYAATEVLTELLPVVDDLERALQADSGTEASVYRQGVELILKQLHDLLKRRGVTSVETLGTDFDPNVHQAVMHDVSATHREGEVMEELRRGYKLRDRLLRPAMVKVAKAS